MPRFTPLQFKRIVFASALYDLVLTAPFATPWSFALVRERLSAINLVLGGQALPLFSPFHTLMAGLLGSIVVVWSLLRLRAPEQRFGRYDALGRVLFSLWMLWAWQATQAPVLWLFLLPEMAWALLQLAPVEAADR